MTFSIETKGHYDFVNITEKASATIAASGVANGAALVFVMGTTAALTVMEREEGSMEDMKKVIDFDERLRTREIAVKVSGERK